MPNEVTAEEILGTTPAQADRIFPGDEISVGHRFRDLIKRWHPDRCADSRAADVVIRLKELRDARLSRGETHHAVKVGHRAMIIRNVLREHRTEFGRIIMTKASIGYLIEGMEDLAKRAMTFQPRFADATMRAEIARFLPDSKTVIESNGCAMIVYRRDPDYVLLADLMEHCGTIDPKQVAWMISGMLNLACWLSWARISHGGISPFSIMVSPTGHSVALSGPLLYMTDFGERPAALPDRTLSVIPRIGLSGQTASPAIDLELIRRTAREALGDPSGTRLLSTLPPAFAMWLMTPAPDDAVQDYTRWSEVIVESYGPRKFVDSGITPDQIYRDTAH